MMSIERVIVYLLVTTLARIVFNSFNDNFIMFSFLSFL